MSESPEPLEIVYQDECFAIIHKPAGHIIHPADKPQEGDLVAMKILRDQIGQRVYSIHRLDRPTAGVVLFGIDREVTKLLHKDLEDHEMQKVYWAVIKGKPEQTEWSCHTPIQKQADAPLREAHTDFKLLKTVTHESGEIISLLEAVPHTGRFHQIRRHLLEAGFPIVGDYRYAGIEDSDKIGEQLDTGTRMLLLAKSLTLKHPKTGDLVYAETSDPLIDRLFSSAS